MANEIIKYHNDMNRVALRKFTASELNIFLAICSRMKDKGLTEIEFDFDYLRDLINYSSTDIKDFVKDLDNTYKKLIETNIRIGDDRKWIRFVLFTRYIIDLDKKTVSIKVNEEFKWVLNELSSHFTRYELNEFIDIKSSYAKECYRRLKQFRVTGRWETSLNEFRRLLDIPETYRMCDIDLKVLKPIEKELKPYFDNLKIEKIKTKGKGRGGKVSQISITFNPKEVIKEAEEVREKTIESKEKKSNKKYKYKSNRKYENLQEILLNKRKRDLELRNNIEQ